MLKLSKARLKKLCIHKVGDRSRDEGIFFSQDYIQVEDDILKMLERYFLSSVPKEELFQFQHHADLNLNTMYGYATQAFENPDSLFEQSTLITEYLYSKSDQPNVKSGEVYVAWFTGCIADDEEVDAIGIFKSENKSRFLKIYPNGHTFQIKADEGIDVHKLDRGCLILNSNKPNGYIVSIADRASDKHFWKGEFLSLEPIQDNYYQTQSYIKLCNNFVADKLREQQELSRGEEIGLLNESINFFKENENFQLEDFTNNVIKEPEIIDAFLDYKKTYEDEKSIIIADEFNISPKAVKSYKKFIKSILKLDKNFHVYVHGNKDFIEHGFDDGKGLSFYKLYYNEEE